jgi:hypothetical protein
MKLTCQFAAHTRGSYADTCVVLEFSRMNDFRVPRVYFTNVPACYDRAAKPASLSDHYKTLIFLLHVLNLLLFTALSHKLLLYRTPEFGDRNLRQGSLVRQEISQDFARFLLMCKVELPYTSSTMLLGSEWRLWPIPITARGAVSRYAHCSVEYVPSRGEAIHLFIGSRGRGSQHRIQLTKYDSCIPRDHQ